MKKVHFRLSFYLHVLHFSLLILSANSRPAVPNAAEQ